MFALQLLHEDVINSSLLNSGVAVQRERQLKQCFFSSKAWLATHEKGLRQIMEEDGILLHGARKSRQIRIELLLA